MTSRLSVSILGAAMMLSGACATVVPVTPQGVALAPNQRQPPDPSGCHANPGGEACRGDGNTMLAYGVAAAAATAILFVLILSHDGPHDDRGP